MELLTSSYDFNLPDELIASTPTNPRDSAKLLVYDRKNGAITHAIFSDIEDFLPKDCVMIFNDTKVIKARLFGKKPTGAKVELLINRALDEHSVNVFIKGKVKTGSKLLFDANLSAEVKKLCEDGSRVVEFYKEDQKIDFDELLPILKQIGHTPLPPYINRADTKEDELEYQSVFAKYDGAVAAPTASLHFTTELFSKVTQKHKHGFVTLHVGAGTFKPVESVSILNHPMHSEYFNIPKTTKELLDSTNDILCVGTTATRVVEYYIRTKETSGEANLFLHPQNKPLRATHLLTNFHLPKSTLLMLVASFVGLEKTHELYKEAISKNYRFYSYGDALLIL
ncbi:MAG: tRNA preQ1(34) S-adenosylmethionine ribosyltransferase-isomerase QueA [Sulfurimonas sp.]|nr:tRNA preQ1(34) S-adenosylmethionine ribosyltransferase-isomerase QueA [Sulfurimonadaceae bacterium]